MGARASHTQSGARLCAAGFAAELAKSRCTLPWTEAWHKSVCCLNLRHSSNAHRVLGNGKTKLTVAMSLPARAHGSKARSGGRDATAWAPLAPSPQPGHVRPPQSRSSYDGQAKSQQGSGRRPPPQPKLRRQGWSTAPQQRRYSQQPPSLSARLNDDIRASRDLAQLHQLLHKHAHQMDCVHVAALCTALVKNSAALGQLASYSHQEQEVFVSKLCSTIINAVQKMRPRQSSTTLWALGKLAMHLGQASSTFPASPSTELPIHQLCYPGPQNLEEQHAIRNTASNSSSQFGAAAAALLAQLASTAGTASARDLAQGLYGAAQLQHHPNPAALSTLLPRLQQLFPTCQPQDLSMTIYALAVLGVNPGARWITAFLSASLLKLSSCSCQALANIAWALATLQQQPGASWLDAVVKASQECMPLFSNQELTMTAWALLKLQARPPARWLKLLEAEATARLATMNGQDVSLLLMSMEGLGHRPSAALLSALSGHLVASSHVAAQASSSSDQRQDASAARPATHSDAELTAPVQAMAACEKLEQPSLPEAAAGLQPSGPAPSAAASGDAPAAAAHVKLRSKRQASESVGGDRSSAAAAAGSPGHLQARSVCNILTQLSRMDVTPSQGVVDSLLADVTPSLGSMQAGDLVALLHALASLHHRPAQRWLVRYLQVLRIRLPSMGPEQLAGMLWSLARMGVRPEERWMSWVMLECQHKLPDFRTQELANIAWALARLGVRPRQPWLQAFFHHTRLKMRSFKMAEIAMLADAVARSGFRPPEAWLAGMHAEVAARAATAGPWMQQQGSDGLGKPMVVTDTSLELVPGSVHHSEVYSVLRALARIDSKAHGRLPAPLRSSCEASTVLGAACLASLSMMRHASHKRT